MYDLVKAELSDRNALANQVLLPDRAGGSLSFTYDGEDYTVTNGKLYNSKTEVAVVYSPGYGGSWTTQMDEVSPTDARVAVLTLMGLEGRLTFKRYGEDMLIRFKDHKVYIYDTSYGNDLDIHWVPGGTLYRIDEYDGYESVIQSHDLEWHIA